MKVGDLVKLSTPDDRWSKNAQEMYGIGIVVSAGTPCCKDKECVVYFSNLEGKKNCLKKFLILVKNEGRGSS